MLAVIVTLINPEINNHKFIKVIIGLFVGVFFGMVIGSVWVGVDVIITALLMDPDEQSGRLMVHYVGNTGVTYAISTTITGAIGGVTGAAIGIERDNKAAAILGAIIGAVAGVVIVRIALLI